MCVAKHAQIIQHNWFAIWNILKKKNDEVDFLLTDKHESFLQIDTMIFDVDDKAFPKLPK